ncbi:leucine-rich repeat domain-containing protein [Xanthomonas fragariae]|uniref:E3 ubiquitin-protein ligase ipaH4.5 n=2 Tax=Xanthomonas fragariae TaxID=48664 RepID=A0ABY1RLH9_9XANT|nr:leucine-rich repeat domain-containing protein [Xanthomonas fragariae]WIY73063.1 leucine-rich repeat domain-containing protein [Xanthomonas fragariae]SMQ98092.1 putative E3 ubiquitin-protein ligase ipaH4.5 [Xanthomonas fragariae]
MFSPAEPAEHNAMFNNFRSNMNRLRHSRQQTDATERPPAENATQRESPGAREDILSPLTTRRRPRPRADTPSADGVPPRAPAAPRLDRARPILPMPSVATARTSSAPPVTVEQDIDNWLARNLPAAEEVGRIAGINMYDAHRGGDTSKQTLRDVATLIKDTAADKRNKLEISAGLPAKTLPDAIGQMHALQELSLFCTSLTSLPESLGQLGELCNLRVATSPGLKTLPSSLTALPKLKNLQLTGLPLEQLPADLGNLKSLRVLTLGHGKYTCLPASVTQLRRLRELTVSTSKLQQLPEDIGQMKGLRLLTLHSTSLERIPASLTQLEELTELNLSSNAGLTQLPEDIGQLNKLEKLNLTSNRELEQLPANIGQLRELKKLSLKNCKKLTDLPDSLGDLSQLKFLDLTGTGMTDSRMINSGTQTLPQCLARLPADCEIEVPPHMRTQLFRLRYPEQARARAQAVDNLRAGRLRSQAEQGGASWNRVPEFKDALARIRPENPALVECFDNWTQALAQDAVNYGRGMTSRDMPLLDKVVAHAIESSSFRSVFEEFLRNHTNKYVNLDGMTQVGRGGGRQAAFGDVRTAFSKMLEHKLMHMHEQVKLPVEQPVEHVDELRNLDKEREQALSALQQEAALNLLQEAIKDLGMSRRDLLNSTNELTWKSQMWPPLRAYVSMHDLDGRAALEAACAIGSARSTEAEDGIITQQEVLDVYRQEEARANAAIDKRAEVLVSSEWRIP